MNRALAASKNEHKLAEYGAGRVSRRGRKGAQTNAQGTQNTPSHIKCHKCSGTGHTAAQCPTA